MNRNFSQTITVRCDDPAPIVELLAEWDLNQATSDIMGYMGTRLLADRENAGQYVIIADFGVVDPNVSAADEAARNNDAARDPARGPSACSSSSTASPSTTTSTSSTARTVDRGGDHGPRCASPSQGSRFRSGSYGAERVALRVEPRVGVPRLERVRDVRQPGRRELGEVPQDHRLEVALVDPLQTFVGVDLRSVVVGVEPIGLQAAAGVEDEDLEHRLAESEAGRAVRLGQRADQQVEVLDVVAVDLLDRRDRCSLSSVRSSNVRIGLSPS